MGADTRLPPCTCAVVYRCLSFICFWHSGEPFAESNVRSIQPSAVWGQNVKRRPDFTLLHHKRLLGIEILRKTSPRAGSCRGRLHRRNPRRVPELWGCAGRRLAAAPVGSLPGVCPAEMGGRAVVVWDNDQPQSTNFPRPALCSEGI